MDDRARMPAAMMPAPILPLAVKSKIAAQMIGISATKLDSLIAAGEVEAKRSGKNRLVLVASLQRYLDRLPDVRAVPQAEPAYRAKRVDNSKTAIASAKQVARAE